MPLSFSTKWPERMGELAGQPNCFVEKIWVGLCKKDIIPQEESWAFAWLHKAVLGYLWDGYGGDFTHKLHTIREDKNDRWKAGNDIHFVINNRTKDRFHFAPVVRCVSVQEIEISYKSNWWMEDIPCWVGVDGYDLTDDEIKTLALNDGFPSVEDFFNFFDKDFVGKIIHWTDLKY